jgi:hypothetical protein
LKAAIAWAQTYPVSDKAPDAVEHLPEGHDLPTDVWRRYLIDVRRPSCESNALPNTNEHAATDEDADLAARSEALHESRNTHDSSACNHTDAAPEVVSNGTGGEPTSGNCADIIGRVERGEEIGFGSV